jgi:hypothetical protein
MNGIDVKWTRIPVLKPAANWHARIVTCAKAAVQSWDFTNAGYAAAAVFADSCQALTFDTDNNGHFFEPPAGLDDGEHILQLIDAAVPAVTHQPVCKIFRWNKSQQMVTWIGDV